MLEETISLEESTSIAFSKLRGHMPSIGFLNRKKRIKGYLDLTSIAEYMITSDEITEEGALFILSVMMRKCADFQKSAMMTALSLSSIDKGILSPIGLKFILEVRLKLNLPSTHHCDKEKLLPTEKNTDLDA